MNDRQERDGRPPSWGEIKRDLDDYRDSRDPDSTFDDGEPVRPTREEILAYAAAHPELAAPDHRSPRR